ncbi:Peptidase C19, ubiquitin carboxyl-terminal hydrolase [Dillenia turbinata]|uniref:ubiquitinyl hydrolase 1 n=1 Tax=Dillenia turbinata TaxID=194707 RepID=A0AAN8ZW04_9MAGN
MASQLQLQMSWQPSLLHIHQKRKNGPPLGLKNLGNSCYLNSVLQCLTYTPPLAYFCLNHQHSSLCNSTSDTSKPRDCPFCIIEKRIACSLSVDLTLDSPARIQSCLRIFAEHFRLGRQEDAHEFLRYVIDACHNTCLRLKKLLLRRKTSNVANGGSACEQFNTNSTVVKEIFGGALRSQVKCLSCGAESNKTDEIMDISLDIIGSASLKQALQKFFQPEVLDGNNKYKCDNCKKLVAARKQMSIQQAPNVLVIQLKRFEGILGAKIDRAIAFEEVMVLSSYMCQSSQDAMGRWYCCNDSYVSLSTLQEVLSEKVYILFFSRTKQRSVPVSLGFTSNGVKSHDSNGSDMSTCPKEALKSKAEYKDLHVEQTSGRDVKASHKVGKVISNPPVKFSISGISNSRKVSGSTGNGSAPVSKSPPINMNGDGISTQLERNGKENTILTDRKGVSVGIVTNKTRNSVLVLANGNGKLKKVSAKLVEYPSEKNGTALGLTAGNEADSHKLPDGVVNFAPDLSGFKRKSQDKDVCILSSESPYSREVLEELKEALKKEADLVLRSCGWYDKVYSFMCSRKRFCTEEARTGLAGANNDELKKLLISDAKPTFISQIPESLKENLIQQLRSFSDGK